MPVWASNRDRGSCQNPPQHILYPVDEFIIKLWKNSLKNNQNLTRKKHLKKTLNHLYFITDIYNQNKNFHIDNIVRTIYEQKKAKKITSAEQAVKQRRKIYEQKAAAMSHLHIDGYGISLGITKNHISIKEYGKKIKKFPVFNLKQITIASKATSISTKLIKYCADHNISVDFVNKRGMAYAKIYHYQSTHNRLWLKQMRYTTGKTAFEIARLLAMTKINNQIKLIKYFSKYARKTEQDVAIQLPLSLNSLKQTLKKIKQMPFETGYRQILMGYEGSASAQYWQWFKLMVDEETDFAVRKTQGATDLVNSLLNYGYAILYRQVWNSVIRYGLHPELSFLHSYQKGKGTLIFDLIEPFRQPVIDRAVLSLINRKTKLKAEQGKLDDKTKQKLITAVYKNLTRYDKYLGERLQMIDIVHKQTQQLKLYIDGQNKKFKPYKTTKW